MEKPSLYKKESISNIKVRPTQPLSVDEQTKVSETISKFFELFINKHLT
jgi:hypothetical protein